MAIYKIRKRNGTIVTFDPVSYTHLDVYKRQMPYQRVNIFGTKGRIKVDIPFNAPPHIDSHIWLHTVEEIDKIIFEAVDQYTIQGDLFARAILDEDAVPTPLEDAVKNMLVIEAIKNSSDTNKFVPVERLSLIHI